MTYGMAATPKQVTARLKIRKIAVDMGTDTFRRLVSIVFDERPVQQIGKAEGFSRTQAYGAGMAFLQCALDNLADAYYGVPKKPVMRASTDGEEVKRKRRKKPDRKSRKKALLADAAAAMAGSLQAKTMGRQRRSVMSLPQKKGAPEGAPNDET